MNRGEPRPPSEARLVKPELMTPRASRTPLIGALIHNDTAEAQRLLAKGADPNEGQLVGFSPIFLSLIFENKTIFHAIAAKGVDLQQRDPSGSTLLTLFIRATRARWWPCMGPQSTWSR